MICQLSRMDVANASMYDGSTAGLSCHDGGARERVRRGVTRAACILSTRVLELTRSIRACRPRIGYVGDRRHRSGDLDRRWMNHRRLIIQSPNFFGIVEQVKARLKIAHRRGALLVVCSLRPCVGDFGTAGGRDIVAGDAELAISPCYGGPYAGHLATKEKLYAADAGRRWADHRFGGNLAFCADAFPREQHIRREKATSNICTNQALIALMATVIMTVYGKQGLRELAETESGEIHYWRAGGPAFSGNFFNESWCGHGVGK